MFVEVDEILPSSINITDATNCPSVSGANGLIQILPDSPLWTYSLSGADYSAGPSGINSFSNLSGGIYYFVHIENTNGCVLDTAVFVGLNTNNVTADFIFTSVDTLTCFSDSTSGAEFINTNGGITPPYDVYWYNADGIYEQEIINAGQGDAVSGLSGGNWVVAVVDQEGCAWSQNFVVVEPDPIKLNFTVTNPNCYGFSDGAVILNSWPGASNPISVIMTNASGAQINLPIITEIHMLAQGWYFIQLTDNNGCIGYDSAYVDDPDIIDITYSTQNLNCWDDGDGYIVIDTVTGYFGLYGGIGYYWNPDPNNINGIGANENLNINGGDYTLTINDMNGCSRTFDIALFPGEFYFTSVGSTPYSPGGNASVFCNVSGGTAPYDYTWTYLGDMANFTGDSVDVSTTGLYLITAEDAHGCIITDTVYVGQVGFDSESNVTKVDVFADAFQTGVITVNNNEQEIISLMLYNMHGKLIYQGQIETGTQKIYLNIPAGVYFYEVNSSHGLIKGKLGMN
ncbi:MAG: T9SS type A sorting domain-containing protein [Crocinitomicaceae bacterium]|nr:T9SS type A sorting domain-containing protein [Crocinitomicaceae bacterium]